MGGEAPAERIALSPHPVLPNSAILLQHSALYLASPHAPAEHTALFPCAVLPHSAIWLQHSAPCIQVAFSKCLTINIPAPCACHLP